MKLSKAETISLFAKSTSFLSSITFLSLVLMPDRIVLSPSWGVTEIGRSASFPLPARIEVSGPFNTFTLSQVLSLSSFDPGMIMGDMPWGSSDLGSFPLTSSLTFEPHHCSKLNQRCSDQSESIDQRFFYL
ncbi:hypothetical protein V6N13_080377 [Hibiscus sabdariffa]|uniref:Uncharacterized protein n=1 Tax=Hibiscus sabdariffa TaxID=183260 RepID=A0ABR2PY70_9ROSI